MPAFSRVGLIPFAGHPSQIINYKVRKGLKVEGRGREGRWNVDITLT